MSRRISPIGLVRIIAVVILISAIGIGLAKGFSTSTTSGGFLQSYLPTTAGTTVVDHQSLRYAPIIAPAESSACQVQTYSTSTFGNFKAAQISNETSLTTSETCV